VLRGGVVFDGSGSEGRIADVAIEGERITAVGRVVERAALELDVSGLVVSPGFIDVHSHADRNLLVNPNAESRIRQGVTLEVVGQDGSSIEDLPAFFEALGRQPPAVNLASMVGHGTIRRQVMGLEDRPATEAELDRMRALVRQALEQGVVGLSSGLEYTPGSFAEIDELVELAEELRGTGLPYASHMRNEDDGVLAAIEEAIHVGRMAGVPVQISHLKAQGERNYWKADAALRAIEAAREAGVDVHFDRYPYVAYSTGLSNLFPGSARAGGTQAFLARLRDPETAEHLEEQARGKVALLGSWNSVQISSASARNAQVRGRRLGELAAELGEDPYELTVRLLEEENGSVGMIGFGMSEENTAKMLSHPLGMVCSDGGAYAPYGALSEGSPHPRGYGSFPRLLGHYVRERRDLPLAAAIHKITEMPARKLRLPDRGVLRPGAFADVTVFDADRVADRATFEEPHQYPVGIEHVVVNGALTIRDAEQTGSLAGRPVRLERGSG
jgi:N-acyl-D-amino-acid deacylase